jgi:hypothetical protein
MSHRLFPLLAATANFLSGCGFVPEKVSLSDPPLPQSNIPLVSKSSSTATASHVERGATLLSGSRAHPT